ncbi:TetR/AcrR family transcriptional regulator [Sorangium sp. So ce131]|uniref:TetR/AcrR family transcriptional regulator n=1 Tax=Sorangium sp. So ce131 TaxID=3133282 RepID=UPI003F5DE2A2
MSGRPGLRERKKQQTRLAISQVATRMFIERGFDHVTVAEVAQAAQVSVNTVFNYFATKEELFFDRAEEVEDAPSRIVRERREGESAIDALHRGFLDVVNGKNRKEPWLAARLRPFLATVDASPALRTRGGLMLAKSEHRLAQTLIEESGAPADDPTARVVAAMVIGLERVLVEELQTRVLRGDSDPQIRAALSQIGERGFALLRSGIGSYCTRASSA